MPIPRKQTITIRLATATDTDFILSLVPRLVDFELPQARRKREVVGAIRVDIERALHEAASANHFFIAENRNGIRAGFLHLQLQRDFFSGARACHISDLVITKENEGCGIGRALLAHAQAWAKSNDCKLLTLSVFPGNVRALSLYERDGFAIDLLRMTKPIKQDG